MKKIAKTRRKKRCQECQEKGHEYCLKNYKGKRCPYCKKGTIHYDALRPGDMPGFYHCDFCDASESGAW